MPEFHKQTNTQGSSIFVKLLLMLVVAGLLLFVGTFTALAPQFTARLLLLPILVLFVLFAFLSQSRSDVSFVVKKWWLILLLSTMALWPTYMLFKLGGLPTLDARRIVAGLTIAVGLYLMIARQPLHARFRSLFSGHLGVVTWLLLAYMLIRVVSCFASIAPFYSFIQVVWEVLYYYSMFFIGAVIFDEIKLHQVAVNLFMVLAVLISMFAVVEWITQTNVLIQFAPINESFLNLQKALSISRLRDGFFRAQGTFEHPLLLAEFAAMAACFGLSSLLWPSQLKQKLLGFSVLVLALLVALLTGSRSALVSIPIAMGAVTIIWLFANDSITKKYNVSSRTTLVYLCVIVGVLLITPLIIYLAEGASKSEAASSAGRLYMLELGWESIKAHPFIGTGPGTAGMAAGIVTGSGLATLDNYFLAIAIESGVTGLLLLFAVLLYPVWVTFRYLMLDAAAINQHRIFLSSVLGLLIVTVVMHTILWMPYNLFFAFLFSGMVLASETIRERYS